MIIQDFLNSERITEPFYVLFGRPVGHSMSPMIHNFALRYHKLAGTYTAVEVPECSEHLMKSLLWHEHFCGANVTIPFKHEIRQFLSAESEICTEIGAVNTVVAHRSTRSGFNTDVDGFLRPLAEHASRIVAKDAVILGTGGAAKAAIFALFKAGMQHLTLVSRNPEKVKGENWYQKDRLRFISYEQVQSAIQDAVLVVNTTPLGMYPNVSATPLAEINQAILEGKICYDIIYNPVKTTFLKQAEHSGAHTIDGLEMFIGQASVAFHLWTGYHFPDQEIRTLLEHKLHP